MSKVLLLLTATLCVAAEPQRYSVFRGNGTPASLDDIVTAAKSAEVVFLGENHDDTVAHAIEAEMLRRLHTLGPVILSLEMFERDVQSVLDEYLAGLITEEHLIASGRAWKNYKTDYRPLVEFAKEQHLPVIAANAPRRYVNRVSRLGMDSLQTLDTTAKSMLPPLPYAAASGPYAKKFLDLLEKMQKEAEKEAAKSGKPSSVEAEPKVDPQKRLQAQSLWDASMAYSVAEQLTRHPGQRILHVNGSFHSEERLGIPDHLARYRPATKSLVVTIAPDKSYPKWSPDLAGQGDFVVITAKSPAPSSSTESKKERKH